MRFTPKSQEELDQEREERMKLLAKGRGQFKVVNGETKEKQGIKYHLLTLDVWDLDGNNKTITNVCLHPSMLSFVRSFCYATGLGGHYESGNLEVEDCFGCSGECEIDIEKGEPDGKGGKYPDKNRIKSFIVPQGNPAPRGAQPRAAAAPAGSASMAYAAFNKRSQGMNISPADSDAQWKQAVSDYFNRKPPASITSAEWAQFVTDGFCRANVLPPFSPEQQFKDDDIPF